MLLALILLTLSHHPFLSLITFGPTQDVAYSFIISYILCTYRAVTDKFSLVV